MGKKVTLADIAARVGVSSVAVHKALTDKQGVGQELREQIKTVAEQMGYGKNESAMKTGNIGVVMADRYYGALMTFYGQLYEKVVKVLLKYDYYGILELLTETDENKRNLPKLLIGNRVEGLLVIGQMDSKYLEYLLANINVPTFFLDTYDSSLTFDAVITDGYHGTYMLTNYLIRQGHRNIAFVGRVDATSSIADRYWGYRKALRENHINFHDSWEISDRNEGGIIRENIIGEVGEVEAYVCNCDYTAYNVIQNLKDKGYSVPEDVSIVGFDNFLPMGIGMKDREITSYEVDMEQLADVGVSTLIKKMNGQRYPEGIRSITGKIIYRNTVSRRE